MNSFLKEVRLFIKIALPLMATLFSQKAMQLIDTLMTGWLGPDALAAGGLATAIFMTILSFCTGILSSVGIFISHSKGANNPDDISSNLQNGIALALIISIPAMLVIWYIPNYLKLLGQQPEIIALVKLLLHSFVGGFPGFLLFLVFREFISAFALTRAVMIITLASIPLTFFINYLLIYGVGWLFPLGIQGIGYGSTIIMWLIFFCLFLYSINHSILKKYLTFQISQFNIQIIYSLLHLGLPSGFLFLLEASLFLLAALIIGSFGIDALAAHQIAMQCATVAYSAPLSLSIATALRISNAVGAKNLIQIKHSALIGFTGGLILAIGIALIFILMPDFLISGFLNTHQLHYEKLKSLTISFLIIAGVFQCFDATQCIANGALRGLKDTLIPMLYSVGCYWFVGMGAAYYLAFYTHLGPLGVWLGLTCGLASTAIILLLRFIKKYNNFTLKH